MRMCPNCLTSEVSFKQNSCGNCGWEIRDRGGVLDFLSNRQREDTTLQNYNDNYEELARINIEKSNIDRTFLRRQAKNLVDYLGEINGASVCEIGIGQGFLCEELLRRGVERIVAVDVAISYLRRFVDDSRVEPYLANAETLPFKESFDVIVSTDVMEHVLNVGSYLYCVNRALVQGGIAAIRVPYREGLLNYSPHSGYGHAFGHLRSFNKDILRIYMQQAGFKVRRFYLDGYSPFIPLPWVMETDVRRRLFLRFQKYVKRSINHWSDVIDLPRPIVATLFRPVEIVVVAEKTANVPEYAGLAAGGV